MNRTCQPDISPPTIPPRPAGRGLLALLLALLALVVFGGCAGETPTPGGSAIDRAKETIAPGSTKKEEKAEAPQKEESKLKVRTLQVRTQDARKALDKNFKDFLKRESLGFTGELLEEIGAMAGSLSDWVLDLPDRIAKSTPLEIVRATIPIWVVVFFLVAFFLLTRQIGRFSHRWQADMHFDMSLWATRLVRGLALVAGRVLSVLLLLGLSYFPVRAIFGGTVWTHILSGTLWLLLAYRLISSVLVSLFSGRIIELSDEHARRLEGLSVNGLRIIFGFLIATSAAQNAEVRPEFLALFDFAFRVTLISFPVALYIARDSVLALLPEGVDSQLYAFFRNTLERNYPTFMLATAALFALGAAGWVNASNFILLRGYAITAVVISAFALFANLRQFLRDRVDKDLSVERVEDQKTGPIPSKQRPQVTRRIEQLVAVALVVVVSALVLRLLLLLEPTIILLRIPFLAVGQARISFLNIFNLVFIVLGTVLVTKSLRAVMNAKIYPMFEVDVGVAYAINTLIKYALVLTAFFLGLAALGVDLTAITVVLASLGVGIGFGLQTLVENLISGFIILFGRSVQKGDFITVEGTYGQVEAVGARSVVISTPDNFEMLVPSKEIVGGRIINWSYENNTVRARLEVGVSYQSEPKKVRDMLIDSCKNHRHVLSEPAPNVRLTGFGDSSIDFELLFFFDCRETTEGQVIGELNFDVWESLVEADIEIPFPQRDLHLKNDEDWEKLEEVARKHRESMESGESKKSGESEEE